MSATGGSKRPPSSPLESSEYKRKMESGNDHEIQIPGGSNNLDNKAIITEIKDSLPNLINKVLDSNMAAMEERLVVQINNMTKRLEDKIEASNLSNSERFDNLESVQDGFVNRLQDFEDRVNNMENLTEKLEGIQELNTSLHDMLIALAKRVVVMEKEREREKENRYTDTMIEELKRQIADLASEVRDKRICISGIKEVKNETPKRAVVRVLNELSSKYENPTPSQSKKNRPIISEDDIDIAYRTGKKIGKSPQNIVVHIKWVQTKMKIMSLKKKLIADKQSAYFISEDIPFELRGLRQKIKNINEAAKKLKMDSKIVGNKILLNGKMYTSADLDGLPDDLLNGAAQIKEVQGGLAYRGEEAFLSNFHHAAFVLDDHKFVNVEQYYQYKKCLTLGQINMAAKILRTSKPLQAKSLGDKYEDTESDDWMETRSQCMLNGTVAKFTQNPDLASKLIDTGEKGLYEATTDKYFGTGIGLGSKLWLTGRWTGENIAGKICMNVRKLLINELTHGANLTDLGDIITYPVSTSRIPDAIDIWPKSQVDQDSQINDEEASETEPDSESEESSINEEGESEMDTGLQEDRSSQVETEPKEQVTVESQELNRENQGSKKQVETLVKKKRMKDLQGGKDKRKSKGKDQVRGSEDTRKK